MGKSINLKNALSTRDQSRQAKSQGKDATRENAKAGAMYRRLSTAEKAKYHLS